ncbi:hypothetical protein TNCV_2291981 [Trichonephila clavipes]|uniref:Uncharacterized protein n=1 Tax=Trichonephila clavipes TaxID=2585209 RepID=A0A8X6RLB8_TRICX|nr:hypothetical protein TNCV_2291981 [Trichonephila clavipes]
MIAQTVKQRNDVLIAKAIIHRFLALVQPGYSKKEITAIKIKDKISYPEARRVVSSRTPVSGKSYASATRKTYISTAIQVDASTAPTSAIAATMTPKNVAVDTLKSVSPPRDHKKNRKTRIKESGCNPTKKEVEPL